MSFALAPGSVSNAEGLYAQPFWFPRVQEDQSSAL